MDTQQTMGRLAEAFAELGLQRVEPAGPRTPGSADTPAPLHQCIDHTVLRSNTTPGDVDRLCEEALEYAFKAVCVHAGYVERARARVGIRCEVASVVDFPHGAGTTASRVFETQDAVRLGASEIDVVLPIGLLLAGDFAHVHADLRAVVQAASEAPVKVILETSMLSAQQKIAGAMLADGAGAAYVKTSTGFGGGGATVADVRLLREVVRPDMGIKASGGIATGSEALKMIAAGATRIGTSSGPRLMRTQE